MDVILGQHTSRNIRSLFLTLVWFNLGISFASALAPMGHDRILEFWSIGVHTTAGDVPREAVIPREIITKHGS